MRIELLVTAEFQLWLDALSIEVRSSVASALVMLRDHGVMLAPPYSRKLTISEKLIELRIQHSGEPYRVLYVFVPKGKALLLVGGKKTGEDRWYEVHVPRALKLYTAYMEEPEKIARKLGDWRRLS